MKQRLRAWFILGGGLAGEYGRQRAALAAGGLAYFVALSLGPAALALGSLVGLVVGPDQLRTALESVAAVDGESSSAIDALVGLVETGSASSFTVTTIVSVVVAVYAASKVVVGLRQAMNAAFGVTETRSGLVERGVSAVVTLVGLVAAATLVVLLTVLPPVRDWLGVQESAGGEWSWVIGWAAVVALVYAAVRWTLHHAPNGGRRVPWWSPGVVLATSGIVAVTVGVGIFARYSGSLGAAVLLFGSAIVVLLWLYLCFVALLWGAHIEAYRQRTTTRTSGAALPPAP